MGSPRVGEKRKGFETLWAADHEQNLLVAVHQDPGIKSVFFHEGSGQRCEFNHGHSSVQVIKKDVQ